MLLVVICAHFLQPNCCDSRKKKDDLKLKQGKSKSCVCTCILTIRVFSVQAVISRPGPWQQVIITAIGHPIVTNANDLILLVHYTRPHLQRGAEVPQVRYQTVQCFFIQDQMCTMFRRISLSLKAWTLIGAFKCCLLFGGHGSWPQKGEIKCVVIPTLFI